MTILRIKRRIQRGTTPPPSSGIVERTPLDTASVVDAAVKRMRRTKVATDTVQPVDSFSKTVNQSSTLWQSPGTTQTINLLTTDSGTIDRDDYANGAWSYTEDQLPTGFTVSGARRDVLTYGSLTAQSITCVFTADDGVGGGGDNFVTAAAEAGAFFSTRFATSADVTGRMLLDGTQSRASRQTTSPPPGATGFMRFAVLNTDGTNSGNWREYINPGTQAVFGNGSAYGVRYLYRVPAHMAYFPFPGTQFGGPYGGGAKQHIQSWYAGSNQTNEVVIQNSDQRCAPQMYHRNTNGDYLGINVPATGSDYRYHPAVDLGGDESSSAARFLRYGLMYSGGANIGAPNTTSASFWYHTDVWMVMQTYLEIGTLGTASTRLRMWASVLGDPPKKLIDSTIEISNANGGHNAIWLLPYHTLRTSGGGQDTYADYGDVAFTANIMRWPDGTMPS